MKKKIYVGGGALLCAAVVVVTLFVLHRAAASPANLPEVYLKQAKAVEVDSKPCAQPNRALQISTKDRSVIENTVILHILDVPAGTNVDINIASFSDSQVTGSAIYPKDYGKYNFTLNIKQDSPADGWPWNITSFKPCKV